MRRLPKRQRLKLAEELWISSIDDSAPVSPEHKKTLDKRWSAYRAGKVKPISMTELERRLARKSRISLSSCFRGSKAVCGTLVPIMTHG